MLTDNMKIALIIPTYRGIVDAKRLVNSLLKQSLRFEMLVVDSSSNDGTVEFVSEYCRSLVVIKSSEFNHGGTRQFMIDEHPNYDLYVFVTQDAYFEDSEAIEKLLTSFDDQSVGAVCGRQLPHLDANVFATHARHFNYPKVSSQCKLDDTSTIGLKAAFMSNSFAAYRNTALKDVQGFPKNVIFGEDMYVAAKMLLSGWAIAYSSSACCRHSHNYTIAEEARRYFDVGVFHARESWIQERLGGAGGEGVKFVLSELEYLGLSKIYLWPAAILRNMIKFVFYKLGKIEGRLPVKLKKSFSMNKNFWS
jgi:rhamnosyltransferase